MRLFLPRHLLCLAATIVLPLASARSRTRNPIGAISTVLNATIHTPNHRVTALSQFELTFNIRDEVHVRFHLEPNHDILADDATVSYMAPDGSITHVESVDRMQHKVYKGTASIMSPNNGQHKWESVGWARATVSTDGVDPLFEGAFTVHHDGYHIQSSTNYVRTKHRLDPEIESTEFGEEYMVVWRDSDILPTADDTGHRELRRAVATDVSTCQADTLHFNMQPDHPVYLGYMKRTDKSLGIMDFSSLFSKRQIDGTTGGNSAGVNLVSTIGQTAGCPTTRKVALVGVATDCTYLADFNSSSEAARENVISQMNQASAVWESTFNISLGLQSLLVSNASCPATPAPATEWNQACSDSVDLQDRLNYFSAWRGTQQDSNSHWTLLSTCNTGSEIGLAWLGQACVTTAETLNSTSGSETVSGTNVVIRTGGASEWQIIAHETGHTYGAVHDCTSTTCADANTVNAQQCCPLSSSTCDAGEQYIMNPSAIQGVTSFSMCTVGNICSAMGRNSVNSSCLTNNKAVTTISGSQCGNGIVEAGEECDCGGTEGCGDDPCCDPTTCQYTSGSVCDDANDDCCHNCQLAANGTVCRTSTGVCDPSEVCTGASPTCPPDVTAPNGESCGSGLQCASGQCTSRDQQCKTVMGSYTQGNDTYACDDSGCVISCASPDFGTGVCYGLQQNFLDGTDCGGDGKCSNGQCKGATVGGELKSWIDTHKALVIGVCCAIGGLLLLALAGCLTRRCTQRRVRRKAVPKAPMPPPGGWPGWGAAGQPAPMAERSKRWRGLGGGRTSAAPAPPPEVPPPAYRRVGSVRYA